VEAHPASSDARDFLFADDFEMPELRPRFISKKWAGAVARSDESWHHQALIPYYHNQKGNN
jgi:hypothetical protein